LKAGNAGAIDESMVNETMSDGRPGFPAELTIGHRLIDHAGRNKLE
jgi:hypothetical protein